MRSPLHHAQAFEGSAMTIGASAVFAGNWQRARPVCRDMQCSGSSTEWYAPSNNKHEQGGAMPSSQLVSAFNEQIGVEFEAQQQYIAIAAYYDSQTLPQLASFFYKQAVEERNHAMAFIQYLLDTDSDVEIPGLEVPKSSFSDIADPVALALSSENDVTDRMNKLSGMAREDGDYASEQFLQWFVKEQVEEVSSMTDLLTIVERGKDNPILVEDYLARETIGGGGVVEADMPSAAGGAL